MVGESYVKNILCRAFSFFRSFYERCKERICASLWRAGGGPPARGGEDPRSRFSLLRAFVFMAFFLGWIVECIIDGVPVDFRMFVGAAFYAATVSMFDRIIMVLRAILARALSWLCLWCANHKVEAFTLLLAGFMSMSLHGVYAGRETAMQALSSLPIHVLLASICTLLLSKFAMKNVHPVDVPFGKKQRSRR